MTENEKQALRREGFRLGMLEAAALIRKQNVSGMAPVDPAAARENFAKVIEIRAAAFESFFERSPIPAPKEGK